MRSPSFWLLWRSCSPAATPIRRSIPPDRRTSARVILPAIHTILRATPRTTSESAAKSRYIAIDEPVDAAAVAAHLKATRGRGSIDIPSAYHSNWLDNARAKFDLNWRPRYDLAKLITAAWTFQRAPDDPRKVWYPG